MHENSSLNTLNKEDKFSFIFPWNEVKLNCCEFGNTIKNMTKYLKIILVKLNLVEFLEIKIRSI